MPIDPRALILWLLQLPSTVPTSTAETVAIICAGIGALIWGAKFAAKSNLRLFSVGISDATFRDYCVRTDQRFVDAETERRRIWSEFNKLDKALAVLTERVDQHDQDINALDGRFRELERRRSPR